MQLHGVQQAALNAAGDQPGFAYYMEQGLGKSLTLLADFMGKAAQRSATRLAIVAPNSFKGGWVSEIEKWGVDVQPFIWTAGSDADFDRWMRKGFDKPPVFILNYEAIRSNRVQEHLLRFASRPAMIGFDESIQVSTPGAEQTKAAISVSSAFVYQRLLSGKPMKKGPHDLFSQMQIMGQQRDRNFYSWKTLFCRMGGFKAKQVVGAQNEDYLAQLTSPYTFWATKAEWTDLPPKLYTTREYEMTAEMKAQYRSMEEEFVLWLNDEEAVTVDAAITKYIKLAQIQTGWIYDEDGTVRSLVDTEKNPRLNLLKEIIDNEVAGKVVVVYHHRAVALQLTEALAYTAPAFIRGGMSPDEVEREKRRFNSDDNCRVICIQTKAGKYGHTLLGGPTTKTHCSTCIFYENTYSSDDRSQLEDRNHRHGQLGENCLYIDLCGTSLDRRMTKALQLREDIFNAVFSALHRR